MNIYKIADEFIRDQGIKLPFIVTYYNIDSRNSREVGIAGKVGKVGKIGKVRKIEKIRKEGK
jgi:hypothetical protein